MQLLSNTTSPYGRIARIAMIEKGFNVEPTIVDPWADDPRLRAANVASRVPTLILDDGTALTESLLIVQWLEHTRPTPSLLGDNPGKVTEIAGVALGVIDASIHTLITRKVTAPVLFDETPIGLRRRRTMAEGLARLESLIEKSSLTKQTGTPTLDIIAAIVALDYLRFRFPDATWMPATPLLDELAKKWRGRASFETTPR